MQTLILVDRDDNFLGYASREECHRGDGKLHRAIAVVLFNERGEFLLQKRKSFLWDGYWDITGATHPLHLSERDETYEEAAQRFLQSEWNIVIPVQRIFSFFYFERFKKYCEHELCALLMGECSSSVQFNPEYAYDMRWCTIEQCQSEIKQSPSSFTPWAKIALEKLAKYGLRLMMS
ncbi:MAG: NUDIX domain-containing protein [Ignavibacteriae bacterium]|nr:NUDIX domain-containing protein [Ignavibacteriota bacterium]